MPYEFEEALIPGATIQFASGNSTSEVITDGEGKYEISVPVGTYKAKAERPGFCAVPRAEFTVSAEKETLLNLLVVVCPTHVGSPLRTRVIGPEPRTHFKPIVIAYLSTASTANGVEY